MTLKFYGYQACDTCRKAKKWLQTQGHALQEIDITTNPPALNELENIYKQSGEELPAFLNRSGVLYREMNMKEKVKTMSEKELLSLLAKNGRLLKRPLVTDGKKSTVGFNEEKFTKIWGS